jgi:hypothetical protein
MRTIFENKLFYAATLLVFTLAVMLSVAYGTETPVSPASVVFAQLDDPTFPACPPCQLPSGPGQVAQLDDPTFPACPPCQLPSGPGQVAQLDDPTFPACPPCQLPSGPSTEA